MPAVLGWQEITLRLALTVLASGCIGLNRWERGRAAGLRTVILVSLAAALAMIQTNQLILSRGKPADSFVVMDIMRLPLGILSGIGFIGAGVIVRREHLILGVTTAATLWYVTVMGLCFGGGQIGAGLAAFALGLAILWGLRYVEAHLRRERTGILTLMVEADSPLVEHLREDLSGFHFEVVSWSENQRERLEGQRIRYEVRWEARPGDHDVPAFLARIARRDEIRSLDWSEGPRSET